MQGARAAAAQATATRHQDTAPKSKPHVKHRGSPGARKAGAPTERARVPMHATGVFHARRPTVVPDAAPTRTRVRSIAERTVRLPGGAAPGTPPPDRPGATAGVWHLSPGSIPPSPPPGKPTAPASLQPPARDSRAVTRNTTRAARSVEVVRLTSAIFEWSSIFGTWKADLGQASASGDVYAAHAYRTTIDAVSDEVEKAYRSFHPELPQSHRMEPEAAHDALYGIMVKPGTTRRLAKRRKAVAASLERIDKLTRDRDNELALRGGQLERARAKTPMIPHGAPTASPEVFRTWLIDQADMALACHERVQGKDAALAESALCQHRFFKTLFDDRAHQGDPWTASRRIRRELATTYPESLQRTLRKAHRHLVQVMVDPNLRPSTTSAESPLSKPVLPDSRAAAGPRRQHIVDQVSAGNPLSAEQVEELTYLGRLADSQGHLEPWGMQVPRHFHQFLASVTGSPLRSTSVETFPETPDLEPFRWLLLKLQSAGYL